MNIFATSPSLLLRSVRIPAARYSLSQSSTSLCAKMPKSYTVVWLLSMSRTVPATGSASPPRRFSPTVRV
jgi:hypothetical protein